MDIYFILWIIIQYSVICYVAALIPALEAPLGWFLCPFVFERFLTFWYFKMLRVHFFFFSAPALELVIFPRSPLCTPPGCF